MMNSPLLTRDDMLELLRVRSLTTLDAMIRAGEIPAPKRFGDSRRLFWHRATVEAFLAQKFDIATAAPEAPTLKAPAPRRKPRTHAAIPVRPGRSPGRGRFPEIPVSRGY